ncbi:30S ribosomal protein S8 [Candidatus Gottesmanbacteria bacterium]|nr:30S ribosomal protein S8 [Candidatus Gottesmanbacteria bacterium]
MVNDPIADMLIQIKNASAARKRSVELPYSKAKMALATILSQEGYIDDVTTSGESIDKRLHMGVKYNGDVPTLTDLRRKSKPGLRVYVKKDAIPTVVGGMGIAILSTPQGIMTGKEAKKRGIGGELLCEVW